MATATPPACASDLWDSYQTSGILHNTINTLRLPQNKTELTQLAQRIHPAAIVDGTLVKVDTSGRSLLTNCFLEISPKQKNEAVNNAHSIDKFITLHRFPDGDFDSFQWFRPSTEEVLCQLPERIKTLNTPLFYTTRDTGISYRQGYTLYNVALTEIFEVRQA